MGVRVGGGRWMRAGDAVEQSNFAISGKHTSTFCFP